VELSVWRNQGLEAEQRPAAPRLRPARQAAALGIDEARTLGAEAFPQDPILLLQVVDEVLLTAFDPTREGQNVELQR